MLRIASVVLLCAAANALAADADNQSQPTLPAVLPLQQPDWLAPEQTVHIARLPKSEVKLTEGPLDIGKLLTSELGSTLAEQPAPVRDERVEQASLERRLSGPDEAQKQLERAREIARRATVVADFDRVIDLCHLAIEAGPTPAQAATIGRFGAWASNARGECLLNAGDEHAAFECFQEALELDPTCYEALHNRAVTLAAHNRMDLALTDFDRVIELAPQFGSAYRNRGEVYTALGQHESAIADYSQAITQEPQTPSHHYARALAHRELGHLTDAVQDLNETLQLDPQFGPAYATRGDICSSLGYWEKASADYQQALSIDARSVPAYQGLAWLLSTCPNEKYRDATKAVEAAERAQRLCKEPSAQLLDTLAAAYAAAGRYDEAVVAVEQAIVATEPSATAPLQARLALYRAGKPYRIDQQ